MSFGSNRGTRLAGLAPLRKTLQGRAMQTTGSFTNTTLITAETAGTFHIETMDREFGQMAINSAAIFLRYRTIKQVSIRTGNLA